MAGRPSKSHRLDVWMNGELVGRWDYSGSKGHTFSYDASWVAHPLGRPLSLSLPLSNGTTPFSGEKVENYFDNLLPDSKAIRKRLATRFGTKTSSAFELLSKIGRDCVGAVQLLPADSPPPDVQNTHATPLTPAQIEHLLDETLAGHGMGGLEEDELRISIAGAQEKTALLWHEGQWCMPHGATPTTHILKLPLGEVGGQRADFSTSVENEWLCGKIAQAYGFPVADSRIEQFGRHKALVVTRFDRVWMDTWWARRPQEDFCQVNGLSVEQKYEDRGGPGIDSILSTLRGSDNAFEDRSNFLGAQLLFWMLAAPDGHAKNFSIFLEPRGRFYMTPLYDVMSAWPVIGGGARQLQWQKVKMAMAIRTGNTHYKMFEIQRRHWNEVAKRNAVGNDFESTLKRLVENTDAALNTVNALLPQGFPDNVADPIFEGIRRQVRYLETSAP